VGLGTSQGPIALPPHLHIVSERDFSDAVSSQRLGSYYAARAFQEMIYKATRPDRPFAFVIVHSLSRFSRDSLHSELYVRRLRKAGVELVSITQTVSSDPSGEMFRKLLNVFDEHQSRENAKHVHRAMCENARQGFWNGSHPPYGYRTQVAERRGAKDKKVLVVDDEEAGVVREIFALATGREGRPLGVKAIACRMTERGISRRAVAGQTLRRAAGVSAGLRPAVDGGSSSDRRGNPHPRAKIRSGEMRRGRHRRTRAQSSLFCSGVARQKGFELLAPRFVSDLLIRR
jgi:DNA invertase Pin-like site-specific DNA recombinase